MPLQDSRQIFWYSFTWFTQIWNNYETNITQVENRWLTVVQTLLIVDLTDFNCVDLSTPWKICFDDHSPSEQAREREWRRKTESSHTWLREWEEGRIAGPVKDESRRRKGRVEEEVWRNKCKERRKRKHCALSFLASLSDSLSDSLSLKQHSLSNFSGPAFYRLRRDGDFAIRFSTIFHLRDLSLLLVNQWIYSYPYYAKEREREKQ